MYQEASLAQPEVRTQNWLWAAPAGRCTHRTVVFVAPWLQGLHWVPSHLWHGGLYPGMEMAGLGFQAPAPAPAEASRHGLRSSLCRHWRSGLVLSPWTQRQPRPQRALTCSQARSPLTLLQALFSLPVPWGEGLFHACLFPISSGCAPATVHFRGSWAPSGGVAGDRCSDAPAT